MKEIKSKETRELYRSLLPHGSQAEIARKVGVSPNAVSQFLQGKHASNRIENAILEVIAELRAKREGLLEKAGFTK